MTHAAPPAPPAVKRRILVVDDDAFQTSAVCKALEDTGKFQVHVLNDPRGTVAAVRAFDAELVLLDVMMPQVDGGTIAARLRFNDATRDVPIVFLTAALEPSELDHQGAVIGGFPFVAKPVRRVDLVRVIEEHLPPLAG